MTIDTRVSAKRVLAKRTLAALGCSVALLMNNALTGYSALTGHSEPPSLLASFATSVSDIPSGEHYFLGPSSAGPFDPPYVLLRKWGNVVVGIDTRPGSNAVCFKGFIEGNKIVEATRLQPPYTPGASWSYQPGEMLDLGQYDRTTAAVDLGEEKMALDVCLEVFSR